MYEKTRFVSGESSAPPIENGVRVLAYELDLLEIAHKRVHDEREDAPAAERLDGSVRGRLHLRHLQLDPHRLEVGGELGLRPRRRVRDEAEPVTVAAQPRERRRPHREAAGRRRAGRRPRQAESRP